MNAAAVPLGTARPRAAASNRSILRLCHAGYLVSLGDRFIFGLVVKPIELLLGVTDSGRGPFAGAALAPA